MVVSKSTCLSNFDTSEIFQSWFSACIENLCHNRCENTLLVRPDDLSILCTRDLMQFYPSRICKDKDVRRLSICYLQTRSIDF